MDRVRHGDSLKVVRFCRKKVVKYDEEFLGAYQSTKEEVTNTEVWIGVIVALALEKQIYGPVRIRRVTLGSNFTYCPNRLPSLFLPV